jgi:pyrroloquinoline-quinone synthase
MTQSFITRLQDRISARSLLTHPFYVDWQEGKLTLDDLRVYAAQYYRIEAAFPRFLSAVHANCPDAQVRQGILSNLLDEEHGENNHRAQWLDFCRGLGMTEEEVLASSVHPNTQRLLDVYTSICSSTSFQEGLAAIYAYEQQTPQVAAEKASGLRDLYGITDGAALAFFDVHSTLDIEHSRQEEEGIANHTAPGDEARVEAALEAGLEAWWGFLDGVNELRPVGAAR